MRIPSGKTDQLIYFVALDSTDLKTRKTGLTTFTVYRSRNGGTATVYTTPTIAELSASNMPGVYSFAIDEDTTIASTSDSEEYCVHITQASMAPVTRTIELYRRDTTSGKTAVVDAAGLIDANMVKAGPTGSGTAQTAGDIFARIGAPAGASVSADIAAVKTDTAAIKVDTDRPVVRTGTAQAGASSAITLDAGASATDNFYLDQTVHITGGTGAGQSRMIRTYVGSTKVANVASGWATTPDNTSTFAIYPQSGGVDLRVIAGSTVSTTTAQLGVNAVQVGATAQTGLDLGANIGTAGAGLTALGDTRIAHLDADVSSRLATSGYTAPPSAATIAQAVWDVLTSALTTVGSIGKLLVTNIDAAISSRSTYAGGDTSGTTTLLTRLTSTRAGLLDHLDADISSRLASGSYTAPDNTSITAIKAKTDSLAFTVAGQVDANIQYVNDVQVNGVGTSGSPWGP